MARKVVRLKFQITGKGSLWSVIFLPEKDDQFNIHLKKSTDRKKWFTEKFDYEVEDDFDYTLIVGARTGTDWKAVVSIFAGQKESEFISLEGTTGDSGRNKSVVEGPSQPVP